MHQRYYLIPTTRILFSTLSLDQYLDFNTATADNLAFYKFVATSDINIRKAL